MGVDYVDNLKLAGRHYTTSALYSPYKSVSAIRWNGRSSADGMHWKMRSRSPDCQTLAGSQVVAFEYDIERSSSIYQELCFEQKLQIHYAAHGTIIESKPIVINVSFSARCWNQSSCCKASYDSFCV